MSAMRWEQRGGAERTGLSGLFVYARREPQRRPVATWMAVSAGLGVCMSMCAMVIGSPFPARTVTSITTACEQGVAGTLAMEDLV